MVWLPLQFHHRAERRFIRAMKAMKSKGIVHIEHTSFAMLSDERLIRIRPTTISHSGSGTYQDLWRVEVEPLPVAVYLSLYGYGWGNRQLFAPSGIEPLTTGNAKIDDSFRSAEPVLASKLLRSASSQTELCKLHRRLNVNVLTLDTDGLLRLELQRSGYDATDALLALRLVASLVPTLQLPNAPKPEPSPTPYR